MSSEMGTHTGYRVGNKFWVEGSFGGPYILAMVDANECGPLVCLVCISSGNRYCDPILVEDQGNLTRDEWDAVLGNTRHYKEIPTTAHLIEHKFHVFEPETAKPTEEASEEDRFDRLRCLQEASSGNTHMTPECVVQRAQKFFEFVKYGR